MHARTADVVKYLLKDPQFLRTVRHCLDEIHACLVALPHIDQPLKLLRLKQRRLDAKQVESLVPSVHHEYIDAVQTDIAAIFEHIAAEYFRLRKQSTVLSGAATA